MKKISATNNVKGTERFTQYLKKAIVLSYELAKKRGSTEISLKDLFYAIISQPKNIASRILEKSGVDIRSTMEGLRGEYDRTAADINPVPSENMRKVLSESFVLSSKFGHVYVGTEHVLYAMLNYKDESFVNDLKSVGIDANSFKRMMLSYGTYQPGLFSRQKKTISSDQKENEESSLEFFARNMNEMFKEGKFMEVWGREEEIKRVIHILSRKTKNNPILVGEAGVGKTAIVEGIVSRVERGEVPKSFKDKEFIRLDLASIIAGSKIRGDVEDRILSIVDEVAEDEDKVLFIDEIHMIIGAGTAGQGSMDVANILKPYLTNGEIRVIGATTFDEYQKYFETDSALARRFQPVMVDEINKADAYKILLNLQEGFENYHNVKITKESMKEAVDLADRYITDRYFPDKAIDIIDEAAAGKKISKETKESDQDDLKNKLEDIRDKKDESIMKNEMDEAVELLKEEREIISKLNKASEKSSKKKYKVKLEDVRQVVSRWTKIPVESLDVEDLEALDKLEPNIKEKIVGQNHAVETVVNALKRSKIGINNPNRPLATLLFLGPTGVGKTQLTKELAKEVFGSEDSLIQIDMSEFMEQHSVAKLIGSPPGYVGFQEGGQLTEKVRRNPYSIILFDEIEKAHPELLNILLQVMEEGHLQDSKGRKVNFKNTIIILTSNIGASEIKNAGDLGFNLDDMIDTDKDDEEVERDFEKMKEKLTEELKDELPPEFLNRLDSVVIFRSLKEEDIKEIVKIELDILSDRLDKKGINMRVTDGTIDYLSEESYDEEYGGRNVRRKVQEHIENAIAEKLLEEKIVASKKDEEINLKVVLDSQRRINVEFDETV
jgi:ATP-dependent Clp protease ATP-binding subunit ClpC